MSTVVGEPNLTCPWCGSSVRRGLYVCRGCHADVVYGATRRENDRAAKVGVFLGVIADLCLLTVFRVDGSTSFSRFLYVALGMPVGMAIATTLVWSLIVRGKPRFFRRIAL